MSNGSPHVCTALRSSKFLDPNSLLLAEKSGPPSGMSTTVVYTYEFRDSAPNTVTSKAPGTASIYAKLRQMEGILRDVYKELGGAERAIREEREGYSR